MSKYIKVFCTNSESGTRVRQSVSSQRENRTPVKKETPSTTKKALTRLSGLLRLAYPQQAVAAAVGSCTVQHQDEYQSKSE